MKKIIACALSVILSATMAVTAFAASGLNAAEQELMDAFKNAQADGFTFTADILNQMENYLRRDGVEVTEAEKDQIIAYLNKAVALVDEAGVSKLTDLSKAKRAELLKIANDAAAIKGLKIVVLDGNVGSYAVYGPGEELIFTSGNPIKATGADYTSAAVVIATLVALMGACVVVSKKKGMFEA